MKRCLPNSFYEDMPCSVVAIGTAIDKLNDSLNFDELNAFYRKVESNGGYATLKEVNKEIRARLKVKKYEYNKRTERVIFDWYSGNKGKAIVCVSGHYLYADFDNETYYSFFDNLNDKVVAVWRLEEIKNWEGWKKVK